MKKGLPPYRALVQTKNAHYACGKLLVPSRRKAQATTVYRSRLSLRGSLRGKDLDDPRLQDALSLFRGCGGSHPTLGGAACSKHFLSSASLGAQYLTRNMTSNTTVARTTRDRFYYASVLLVKVSC